MQEETRKSGIEVVGNIPWGSHFCQFYQTKKDLIDTLVPYFKTGLENNEFCMWITADNLTVDEARKAMTRAVKDFPEYVKKGQIEILSYTQWYLENNSFDKQRVLDGWVEKQNVALKKGFAGLRLTGNTFWLEKKDWRSFADYEETVNNVIGKYKMIALCTYCLDKCNATEIVDVIRNHEFALIKQDGKWEIFENSRYKATKEDLVESEKRFRLAFKNAPITIAAQDRELKFLWAYNQRTVRTEDILGKTDDDLFPPEDAEKLTALKRQVLKTGEDLHEKMWVTSNGKKLYLDLFLEPVRDDKGNITGVEIATVDITGQKLSEQALQESEERYRRLFENNSEGLALCEMIYDKNGKPLDYRFLHINPLFAKIIGLSNARISGKSAREVLPNVQLKAIETFAKLVSDGEPVNFENYSRDLHKWFDVYAYRTGPGQFAYGVIDITARKTTESALKESEEKFRALTEASPVIVSVTRVSDGTVLYVNKSYSESLGYKQEELIGKPALNLYYDPAERKALIDKLNEQGYLQNYEVRVKKSDGTPFWASSSIRFIEYGGERTIMAASIDITDFKQAEEQKIKLAASIQQEKDRLSALVNSIPDEVWFADTNKNFTLANPSALQEFGFGQADSIDVEAMAKSLEVLRPDGTPRPVEEAPPLRALKGEHVKNQEEIVRTPATGELRFRQVNAGPVRDAAGNIIGSVSVVRDITERKNAEVALKEIQQTLEDAQKIAKLGTWEWNTRTGKLYWSSELYDIYGVDPDSFTPDMALFAEFIHPDDRELLGKVMDQLIAGGKAVDVDFRIVLRDESIRYLHATSTVKTSDNTGKGIVYIGTTQDITVRKKAEEDVIRLNRELQAIRECDQIIVHSSDETSLLTEVCRILCTTAGYLLAWVGTVEHDAAKSVKTLVWHGDGDYMAAANITWADTERGRGPTGLAIRTGKAQFFQDFAIEPMAAPWREAALLRGYRSSIAIPLKNETGEVFSVLCLYSHEPNSFNSAEVNLLEELTNDISFGISLLREKAKRQQAEIQIAHLATFPEFNPNPIIELDTEGKIVYLNPAAQAQIPELSKLDTKHPFLADVRAAAKKFKNKPSLIMTTQVEVGDLWYEQTFMFVAATNTYRIYARNVTESKKAGEELKASEERFSKAFHSSPVALSISDSKDGIFIDVNQSFLQLFDYTREELIGSKVSATNIYFNPTDRSEILRLLQQKGKAVNYPVTAHTKNGREIKLLVSAEKIEFNGREHIIWTSIDISEREQAEDLLRETSNYLSNLLDYANAPIIVWDPHFRISRFNPAFERLTGYKSQDVIGLGLDILFPANKKVESMQQIRRTLSGERWEVVEIPILRVDGEIRTVLWNSANVYDNNGKNIIATIAQGQDITERKIAEESVKTSEIKYRRLFEAAKDGIILLDANTGLIIDVNPFLVEMLGMPYKDFIGKHLWDLGYFKDIVANKNNFTELQNKKYIRFEDLPLKTIDGQERKVEFVSNLYEVDHQKIIQCNVRDITARKHAEEQLRETSEYLNNLIDYANAPIIVWDNKFNITRFNHAFERLTGIDALEAIGKPLDILFPENKKSEYMSYINRTTSGEHWEAEEITIRSKAGKEHIVLWNSATLFGVDGKQMVATIAQGQDITERKLAEDEVKKLNEILKQRAAELEISNKELEAFAYSVSHDLRAPLRSMEGFSQALLEDCYDALNDEGKDYLRRIQSSAELMARLIDDLLRLSRITRTDMVLDDVNLTEIAREIAIKLKNSQPPRKVNFVITPGVKARGDENLLTILLDNLLGNAWKFSSKMQEAHIEFGTTEKDGQTVYFIRDNGVGFDMTYGNKLFKPFQRLHSTSEFAGTGIGLASVQRIVQRHGGQVWAEGKVGEGATFYFTLGWKPI